MLSALARFLRWVFTKFATAAAILVLGLAAVAFWLYAKDNLDFRGWRQEMVRSINGERTHLRAALQDVHQRLDALSVEIAAEQDRLRQADKVIAGLKELDSTWDRYLGDRERQKINDARLAKVTEERAAIADEIGNLQQDFTRTTWQRDGLEIALGKLDVRLREVEAKQSAVMHYLERTLNHEVGGGWLRMPVKWWAVLVLGLYFTGPTIGKLALYFGVAPFVVRGKPVRLAAEVAVLPQVSESRVAAEIDLLAGERLWVKEKFLQASDEGLVRKSRYLLDWRIPLTCVATGLMELIEMKNARDPDGGGGRRVTLSNQEDPHTELAVVTIPEGSSLVLRPSFLAGVAGNEKQRLRIRRHWRFFRWQAWATLQFRFFEFVGPCRLIVAGSRGVRAENLAGREGDVMPARRTNQDATIGFTPNLEYRPARAETFWAYYRGMNPLFDDLFAGRGVFLCQQVASDGQAGQARKFWSTVWGGVMKVFGV